MNLGQELKLDRPPKKYEKNIGILVDMLPVVFACLLVCYFSWNNFKKSNVDPQDALLILGGGCAAMLMIAAAAFYATRRCIRKTYIRVCQLGISGVAQIPGFKTQEFSIPYGQLRKVNTKADQLVITTQDGKLSLCLEDGEQTKDLIRSLMV